MTHIKEKSVYNHNYYSCGNMGYEILVECDEQYDSLTYWIVAGQQKILLGCGDMSGEVEFLTLHS